MSRRKLDTGLSLRTCLLLAVLAAFIYALIFFLTT